MAITADAIAGGCLATITAIGLIAIATIENVSRRTCVAIGDTE